MQKEEKLIFKILSLGDFIQEMADNVTILRRPCINLPNNKKKWGNEFTLYHRKYSDELLNSCFYGCFRQDTKRQTYIRLGEIINAPVTYPDYWFITMSHNGDKLDRKYDFKKADKDSWSGIFSTAFHYVEETGEYQNQTTLLLRHDDQVTINGKILTFNAKTENLFSV